MPPRRYTSAPRAQYLVGRRLQVDERMLRRLFGLPAADELTPEELGQHAMMMKCTMMDAGDFTTVADMLEYERRYQPVWPALYARWVEQQNNSAGTEWAVFDRPGKIEFVRRGGDVVVESLAMPNQYALGERSA